MTAIRALIFYICLTVFNIQFKNHSAPRARNICSNELFIDHKLIKRIVVEHTKLPQVENVPGTG